MYFEIERYVFYWKKPWHLYKNITNTIDDSTIADRVSELSYLKYTFTDCKRIYVFLDKNKISMSIIFSGFSCIIGI